MAIFLSLTMAESAGMANGLLAYLIGWHIALVIPLAVWAKNRDAEQAPPKRGTKVPGIAELWVVPPDEDDQDGPITVAVRTDGIRSLEEVVVAVLSSRVLPSLKGGEERWSIVVDGVTVGELTQTWHHPRFWPPIDWNTSPSSPFKGDRAVFLLSPGLR